MLMTKRCFKCNRDLPIEGDNVAFYRHPETVDGFLGKCKDCTKKDVATYRQNNISAVLTYEHQRQRQPERLAKKREYGRKAYQRPEIRAQREEYRSRSEVRARAAEHHQKSREKFPEKYRARMLVGIALRAGTLLRAPCKLCGSDKKLNAHHEDYSKPLEVAWLCSACHNKEHPRI